jgi:hypothetical protein
MGFKKTVDKVLPGAYQEGIQALRKKDRDRVKCGKSRQLAGSVNLDEALKPSDPNGNRWDYGIGIKHKEGKDEVIWVEVHPASTSNVREVLDKLAWLKTWLRAKAPALRQLTVADGYVWIASGGVHIPKRRQQVRLLNQAGLRFPQEHLRLE